MAATPTPPAAPAEGATPPEAAQAEAAPAESSNAAMRPEPAEEQTNAFRVVATGSLTVGGKTYGQGQVLAEVLTVDPTFTPANLAHALTSGLAREE